MTVTEVAAELRVNPETVRRWIKTGRLAGIVTPGGTYRVPRHAVEAVMQEAS